jgi:MoxR-like ATPase
MAASGGAPLRQAGDRFVAFFRELQGAFIEREDVLKQIALALLSRQHVLMTGPPGTAKSQLATRVLGRIVSQDTGQPSLYARQFTESTVQTDLVGPIDFKTLMDTGRTQHFTDEGILGAVHAFLDEVFDGRDMLLRSALNILHERELKQGTKTTRGRIECAIMTSNRYLADILDNERLVAFVDRIAFLSFVPKGFGAPGALEQVLRAQVAGRKPPELETRLTIQDLDLLQAAVDAVYIDDSICGALAALIQGFDAELAAARRANPTFVPSRYLSTRTAVRMGSLLRAICYYDLLFRDPNRPLEAARADLGELRLALTLSGPGPEQTAQLLQRETDPRERRQLTIVRTEREIFDRCLAALPSTLSIQSAHAEDKRLLADAAPTALARHASGRLLKLSRELAIAATSGQRDADDARAALEAVLGELVERALRSGLAMRAADTTPEDAVVGLIELANDLESAGRTHLRAARWLRARALETVDRAITFSAAPLGEVLAAMIAVTGDLVALQNLFDAGLRRMERLAQLRDGLRHAGVDETDPLAADQAWQRAAQRLAAELAPVLRKGLDVTGGRVLAPGGGADLATWLKALEPALARARGWRERLGALGADGSAFFHDIVGPLVAPIAQRAYQEIPGGPRDRVVAGIDERNALLAASGVLHVLPVADVMSWSIEALLRATDTRPALSGTPGIEGYRRLRAAAGHATFASLIVDFYLKLITNTGQELLDPDQVVRRVGGIVAGLPEQTRATLTQRDQSQMEGALDYLERWWATLAREIDADGGAALELLVQSRFFEITHDEGALTRFALEARLSAMVFGAEPTAPLLARLAAMERTTAAAAQRVLTARAGAVEGDAVAMSARAGR